MMYLSVAYSFNCVLVVSYKSYVEFAIIEKGERSLQNLTKQVKAYTYQIELSIDMHIYVYIYKTSLMGF